MSDGEVDAGEVGALIAIVAGRPLTELETGATIRNLYGTRRYSNVAVDAELLPDGGLAVTVYLWRAYIVRTVEFDGKFAPTREDLRRVVPLSPGDPFHAGALEAGAAALERRLAAEGYVEPVVEPEAVFDDKEFTVTVVYRISAGKRARVTEPFFDGDTAPFSPAELEKRMKLGAGDVYREAKARDDAERLRKYLLSQGRFRASVELIAAEPTEDGRIRPVFRIAVGPLFELQATGLKEKAARKQILALLEVQPFDEDLLEQWATDRRGELQRSGRYRATASATADGIDPVVVTARGRARGEIRRRGDRDRRRRVRAGKDAPQSHGDAAEGPSARGQGPPDRRRSRGRRLDDPGLLPDPRLDRRASELRRSPTVPSPGAWTSGSTSWRAPARSSPSAGWRAPSTCSPRTSTALLTVKVGEPFNPRRRAPDVATLTTRYRNTGWASRDGAGPLHALGGPDEGRRRVPRRRGRAVVLRARRSSAATP